MSKNDFYVLLFICTLAAGSALFLKTGASGGQIVIADQSGEIYGISLAELRQTGHFTKHFPSATGGITFIFDPTEGVSVESASCPDKLCLHSAPINKFGQTIACLPGKILATVEAPARRGEPDAVLR